MNAVNIILDVFLFYFSRKMRLTTAMGAKIDDQFFGVERAAGNRVSRTDTYSCATSAEKSE